MPKIHPYTTIKLLWLRGKNLMGLYLDKPSNRWIKVWNRIDIVYCMLKIVTVYVCTFYQLHKDWSAFVPTNLQNVSVSVELQNGKVHHNSCVYTMHTLVWIVRSFWGNRICIQKQVDIPCKIVLNNEHVLVISTLDTAVDRQFCD